MRPETIVQRKIQGALKACGYLSIFIPNRGTYNPRTRMYNIVTDPYFVKGVPDLVVLLLGHLQRITMHWMFLFI